MSEVEKVASLLVNMGSERPQAEVMAVQLLKRADQLAEERGVERVAALASLLELVKAGREGKTGEVPDSTGD